MMENAAPQMEQLKQRMKAAWMAGDFGQVAKHNEGEAEKFVERLKIAAGSDVLDVACGTGNVAIPAARKGARVIGVDIATNLLEQARARASSERLRAEFREGDAEKLEFRMVNSIGWFRCLAQCSLRDRRWWPLSWCASAG